jgi:site-specific DNA-methyltransferase (adenine-specific)
LKFWREILELNKLYVGDSVELLRKLDDNCIDLTITSPPYDSLRKYNGFKFDSLSMAKELYRVTKPGGVVVWNVNDATVNGSETLTSFKQAIQFVDEAKFKLHDTMIYQKNCLPKNHNRYEQDFEYMFIFSKGKPKTFNPIRIPCAYPEKESSRKNSYFSKTNEKQRSARSGKKRKPVGKDKIKGNIWKYSVGKGHSTLDDVAFKHPAIMPEKMVHDHIISWSNEGDLVLDPMCGSATVAKMSILSKREFLGFDISKEYIDNVAIPRLAKYLRKDMFDFDDGEEDGDT